MSEVIEFPTPHLARPSEPSPKAPAESTIDALFHVVRSGDHEYLSAWLRDHADAAPALLKMLTRR